MLLIYFGHLDLQCSSDDEEFEEVVTEEEGVAVALNQGEGLIGIIDQSNIKIEQQEQPQQIAGILNRILIQYLTQINSSIIYNNFLN